MEELSNYYCFTELPYCYLRCYYYRMIISDLGMMNDDF